MLFRSVPLVRQVLKASKAQLALKVPLERTEPPVLPVLTVRRVLRVRRESQDQASVSVVRLPLSAIFPHLRHSPTLTTSKLMAICGSTTRLESGKTSARSKVRKVRLVPQVRLALRVKQELLELLVLKVLLARKVRLVQQVRLVPKVKRVQRVRLVLKVLLARKAQSVPLVKLDLPDRRVTLEPLVLLVRLVLSAPRVLLALLVRLALRVPTERKVLEVP